MEIGGKDVSENSEGDIFDLGAVIEKEESNVGRTNHSFCPQIGVDSLINVTHNKPLSSSK